MAEVSDVRVPKYCTDAKSPFLQHLSASGYPSWYAFDMLQDKLSFWKALAAGLLFHSQYEYPEIGRFLTGEWKKKAGPLLQINKDYMERMQAAAYSSAEYWEAIGAAFADIVKAYFTAQRKNEQAAMIEAGKVVDESNRVAYTSLCTHLRLCISWYQVSAAGRVLSHIFQTDERGQACAFVNIAQDGNSLYLLYHKDLGNRPEVNFPFCAKVSVKGKALVIGEELPQVAEQKDPREALIQALVSLVDAQAGLMLMQTQELVTESSQQAEVVRERSVIVERLVAVTQNVAFPPEALKAALKLPVRKADVRDPHTVTNCEDYPEEGDIMSVHNHKFHQSCLRRHLESLMPVRSFNVVNCPFFTCTLALPEEVLSLHPEFRAQVKALKDYQINVTTQAKEQSALQILSPERNTVPLASGELRCRQCGNSLAPGQGVQHGCELCLSCAYYRCFMNGTPCYACGKQFPEDELQLYGRWYQGNS